MNLITRLSLCAAIVAIIILACHKNETEGNSHNKVSSFSSKISLNQAAGSIQPLNKMAGKLFPFDTIAAWVNHYNVLYGEEAQPCIFSAADLKTVLHNKPDCIGIMFYNAEFPEWGLMAFPVNSMGALFKTDSVISSNGTLSWDKAMSLQNAFEISHPKGTLLGEFFGEIVLDSLMSNGKIQSIRIRRAIKENSIRLSLTDATSTDGTGAEESFPCPPFGKPPTSPN